MTRRIAFLLTITATLAWSGVAQAQGRGGFRPRGVMLLQNKSVQSELKLSDEQVSKVSTLLAEIQAKHRDEMEKIRDLEPQDRMKKFQEIFKAMQDEAKKPLSEILSADQSKRFVQVNLQLSGVEAFARPAVQTALKLTDSQKGQFEDIIKSQNEKRREIFQAAQGDREAARTKMEELNKETHEKAFALLTDEQKTSWKEMTGAPFKLVVEPSN